MILIIIDYFIKICHYIVTLITIDSADLTEIFFKEIISKQRTLKDVMFNRESVFMSAF